MKIKNNMKQAMKKLNIQSLRRGQLKIINQICKGEDVLVLAPTGFGKSLLYQIPAIMDRDGLTIVIEPLLALIHDQTEKLRSRGIAAAYIDSTQTYEEHDQIKRKIISGEIRLLYIAPERLKDHILNELENHIFINRIVIDECHAVITWGSTFREAYLSIGKFIMDMEHKPAILALSATVMPEDYKLITYLLAMYDPKIDRMSLYRSNLILMKKTVSNKLEQWKMLNKYLEKYHKNTTVIFCNTKEVTESLGKKLKIKYHDQVAVYHSQYKEDEADMLSGRKQLIVATTALSLGIDLRNVDLVIHFNLPMNLAEYYQMAGRAGREGQKARSILLYLAGDYKMNYMMLNEIKNPAAKAMMRERLDDMAEYAREDSTCMAEMIMNSLGETRIRECGRCTNCQRRRKNDKAL